MYQADTRSRLIRSRSEAKLGPLESDGISISGSKGVWALKLLGRIVVRSEAGRERQPLPNKIPFSIFLVQLLDWAKPELDLKYRV